MWLLFYARQLREEAEAARLRAVTRRTVAEQRLASFRDKRRLCEAALSRHFKPD